MKNWICLLAFSTVAITCIAQQVVQPILLDKTALSGIGLKKLELDDQPGRDFFQKNLYRGEDLSVYVVSSQSWLGEMNNFSIDEYIYMFNGMARVKPVGEEGRLFRSGEHFFAPKGFTGEWEIMAGDQYHYELSVITTGRADTVLKSRNLNPMPFDRDKLSGADVAFGDGSSYREVLVTGDELTIAINARKPGSVDITEPAVEQVLHIMSGALRVTDMAGTVHEFFSGDYLILPKGFTGQWETIGHSLMKFLSIEKTAG